MYALLNQINEEQIINKNKKYMFTEWCYTKVVFWLLTYWCLGNAYMCYPVSGNILPQIVIGVFVLITGMLVACFVIYKHCKYTSLFKLLHLLFLILDWKKEWERPNSVIIILLLFEFAMLIFSLFCSTQTLSISIIQKITTFICMSTRIK